MAFYHIFFGILISVFLVKAQTEFLLNVGDLGKLQGKPAVTVEGRTYAEFLGIPYGQPPVADLRYKESILIEGPLTPNNGTFDATSFGSECPQPGGNGSETCLFLNVFSPKLPNNTTPNNLGVIVFIHGAAFVSGNANRFTGARLLNKDVVLVTFNYRLGVFGFFSLESENEPGNAALYDTLTVLKFVQKYIAYFGGDPNRVTLAGQSSGSASVSHIMLSPLVKGYFHRAIAASGSALDVWATAKNPLEAGLQVAAYANCFSPSQSVNKTAIAACMRNTNQSIITNAQNMYQFLDRRAGGLGFAAVCPSIQTFLASPFLSANPQEVLDSSSQMDVPLMLGSTRDDGGFGIRLLLEGFLTPNGLINNATFLRTKLIPTILRGIGITDNADLISDAFSNNYLGTAKDSGNFTVMLPGLMDLMSVLFFKSASYRTAQLHSKLNRTYFYSFEYEGQYSQNSQVAHADDLMYVFQLTGTLNEKDQALSDTMVDYWVNFATTGNPSQYLDGSTGNLVVWPEFDETSQQYLHIDSTIISRTDYPDTWTIANKKITACSSTASNVFYGNFIYFSALVVLMHQWLKTL